MLRCCLVLLVFLLTVACLRGAESCDHPEVGFTLRVPEGFVPHEPLAKLNGMRLCAYVVGDPGSTDNAIFLYVDKLSGRILPGDLSEKSFKAGGVTIYRLPWKGLQVDCYRRQWVLPPIVGVQHAAQIPLAGDAIEIGVIGPARQSAELEVLLNKLLGELEGEPVKDPPPTVVVTGPSPSPQAEPTPTRAESPAPPSLLPSDPTARLALAGLVLVGGLVGLFFVARKLPRGVVLAITVPLYLAAVALKVSFAPSADLLLVVGTGKVLGFAGTLLGLVDLFRPRGSRRRTEAPCENPPAERPPAPGSSMQCFQLQNGTLTAAVSPIPSPAPGELLVRVHAAGVTPNEKDWYPTRTRQDGTPRVDAVPGHEFSGVVTGIGLGVEPALLGQAVFGMNDWFAEGATAENCLAPVNGVATKPSQLSHAEAASVPISALTAWQGLFERGGLRTGERVLIHGAAGSVGLFAVQLARRADAEVVATASGIYHDYLRQAGAALVIDPNTQRFEELAQDIDLVFDTVGGETLQRSWSVLRAGGRAVTIASAGQSQGDDRTKEAFFIVEPNASQLGRVSQLLAQGELWPAVAEVVPFAEAPRAYFPTERKQAPGKVVVQVR